MPPVDEALNQETLDSLRATRRKFYAISEPELDAMSPEDQVKYGDNLYKNSLSILRLEAAKLKGVNDQFKEKEEELRSAATQLESNTAALTDAVKFIRAASDGLNLITNIVSLIG